MNTPLKDLSINLDMNSVANISVTTTLNTKPNEHKLDQRTTRMLGVVSLRKFELFVLISVIFEMCITQI